MVKIVMLYLVQVRNRFTVLEDIENKDIVDTLWEGFKNLNQVARSVVSKRRKDVKDWMSQDNIKTIEARKKIKIKTAQGQCE